MSKRNYLKFDGVEVSKENVISKLEARGYKVEKPKPERTTVPLDRDHPEFGYFAPTRGGSRDLDRQWDFVRKERINGKPASMWRNFFAAALRECERQDRECE